MKHATVIQLGKVIVTPPNALILNNGKWYDPLVTMMVQPVGFDAAIESIGLYKIATSTQNMHGTDKAIARSACWNANLSGQNKLNFPEDVNIKYFKLGESLDCINKLDVVMLGCIKAVCNNTIQGRRRCLATSITIQNIKYNISYSGLVELTKNSKVNLVWQMLKRLCKTPSKRHFVDKLTLPNSMTTFYYDSKHDSLGSLVQKQSLNSD